jgi:hypothetical protein
MRRKKPSPPPRGAPLVVAGAALAGALGCGPSHRPVPPQTYDEPYNEVPIDAAQPIDAARDLEEAPQVAPPRNDPPVLPERPGPGDPSFRADPPALVGPFDRAEED